jgi:tuftelin-interacting protein 11
VEAWDPRRDTQPLHLWLHPWLPALGTCPHLITRPARCLSHRQTRASLPWSLSQCLSLTPSHAVSALGDRLRPLYAGIRQKMARALADWQPEQPSAHTLLRPWRDVFAPAEMEALLARTVLPRLATALRTWEINPAAQRMGTCVSVGCLCLSIYTCVSVSACKHVCVCGG